MFLLRPSFEFDPSFYSARRHDVLAFADVDAKFRAVQDAFAAYYLIKFLPDYNELKGGFFRLLSKNRQRIFLLLADHSEFQDGLFPLLGESRKIGLSLAVHPNDQILLSES